jgi:GDPmannose 4,6-dehydratase
VTQPITAVVTGVTGQDGFYLVRHLLQGGSSVHAISRRELPPKERPGVDDARFVAHQLDLLDQENVESLIREVRPDEIYNLAGASSVATSFVDPVANWQSNANAVAILLEAVRRHSPESRVYQASSGEMFGANGSELDITHDEESPFYPASPYAASKAAAHLLCGSYRRAYGLRIACGILFNHESQRRSRFFLSRKVVDHVAEFRKRPEESGPLRVGNLTVARDWGFAPDYVVGMTSILRQITIRSQVLGTAEPDRAEQYRDYVLATGRTHTVWELVDRAFTLAGLALDWDRRSTDLREWRATLQSTGREAVVVDPQLFRPSDPVAIRADPSKAMRELAWNPGQGLDHFLTDMLGDSGISDQ